MKFPDYVLMRLYFCGHCETNRVVMIFFLMLIGTLTSLLCVRCGLLYRSGCTVGWDFKSRNKCRGL